MYELLVSTLVKWLHESPNWALIWWNSKQTDSLLMIYWFKDKLIFYYIIAISIEFTIDRFMYSIEATVTIEPNNVFVH
jgi:hypothetical protein